MVSHLVKSLTKSFRRGAASDAPSFIRLAPSPIQNRARAAEFFATCAAAAQEHRARTMNAPPAPASRQPKSDPRVVAYYAMRRLMQAAQVGGVRDLPEAELDALSLYAEAVASDREDFARMLRRLDQPRQDAAIDARVAWIEADRAQEATPIDVPPTTPRAEPDAFPDPGATLIDPALPPASAGAALPMPAGGMLEWVQGQTPAMWHEIASYLDWTSSGLDPKITAAAHWIALQHNCDRATALTLLARAVADGIDQNAHGHLDLNESRLLMTALHRNLSHGFYKIAGFAPASQLGAEIFRLFRLGTTNGPEARFALDPATVGRLGDAPNSPPYRFRDGRPVARPTRG